jgi:hypothetical protein
MSEQLIEQLIILFGSAYLIQMSIVAAILGLIFALGG